MHSSIAPLLQWNMFSALMFSSEVPRVPSVRQRSVSRPSKRVRIAAKRDPANPCASEVCPACPAVDQRSVSQRDVSSQRSVSGGQRSVPSVSSSGPANYWLRKAQGRRGVRSVLSHNEGTWSDPDPLRDDSKRPCWGTNAVYVCQVVANPIRLTILANIGKLGAER